MLLRSPSIMLMLTAFSSHCKEISNVVSQAFAASFHCYENPGADRKIPTEVND